MLKALLPYVGQEKDPRRIFKGIEDGEIGAVSPLIPMIQSVGFSPCAAAIPNFHSHFFSSLWQQQICKWLQNKRCEPIQSLRVTVKKLQILNAELGIWDDCRQTGEDCTWICALFPAVMLDMVQHASFLMDSLGLLNKWRRQGRAEQFRITFGRKEGEMRSPVPGTAFRAGIIFHSSHLGLDVIPCYDVANGSQSWRGHFVIVVPARKLCKDNLKSIRSLGYSVYSLPIIPSAWFP